MSMIFLNRAIQNVVTHTHTYTHTVKYPVIVCTQTAHGNMSRGEKCIKETSSDWAS